MKSLHPACLSFLLLGAPAFAAAPTHLQGVLPGESLDYVGSGFLKTGWATVEGPNCSRIESLAVERADSSAAWKIDASASGDRITSRQLSADRKSVVIAREDGRIEILEVADGKTRATFHAPDSAVAPGLVISAVVVSPDYKRVAWCGRQGKEDCFGDDPHLGHHPPPPPMRALCYFQDATPGSERVSSVPVTKGAATAFTADSRWLLTGFGSAAPLLAYDFTKPDWLRPESLTVIPPGSAPTSVWFNSSRDPRYAVTYEQNQSVERFFDVRTQLKLWHLDVTANEATAQGIELTALTLNEDGVSFAADFPAFAFYDIPAGKLRIYSLPELTETREIALPPGEAHDATSLALSPDGATLVYGDRSELVHAIDTATGEELWSEPIPNRSPYPVKSVRGIRFAPDGRTFVSQGTGRDSYAVWSLSPR